MSYPRFLPIVFILLVHPTMCFRACPALVPQLFYFFRRHNDVKLFLFCAKYWRHKHVVHHATIPGLDCCTSWSASACVTHSSCGKRWKEGPLSLGGARVTEDAARALPRLDVDLMQIWRILFWKQSTASNPQKSSHIHVICWKGQLYWCFSHGTSFAGNSTDTSSRWGLKWPNCSTILHIFLRRQVFLSMGCPRFL